MDLLDLSCALIQNEVLEKYFTQNKGGKKLVDVCSVRSRLWAGRIPEIRYDVRLSLSAYEHLITLSGLE